MLVPPENASGISPTKKSMEDPCTYMRMLLTWSSTSSLREFAFFICVFKLYVFPFPLFIKRHALCILFANLSVHSTHVFSNDGQRKRIVCTPTLRQRSLFGPLHNAGSRTFPGGCGQNSPGSAAFGYRQFLKMSSYKGVAHEQTRQNGFRPSRGRHRSG